MTLFIIFIEVIKEKKLHAKLLLTYLFRMVGKRV